MDDKNAAEAEAAKCASKLDLAQRLVNALGSESTRWAQSIIDLDESIGLIIGDVLLASSFVSYVGPFNKKFRLEIMQGKFVPFFEQNSIPMSPGGNVLNVLTDPAMIATWNTQKLPSDQVSVENGAILCNSERYSLIIDPQLQGITWLKERTKDDDLQVTRLSNPKVVKTIEMAIESGKPVMLENLDNSIDAVIQPVYSRAVIKKGRNKYIKMGDKELSLNPKFNLFLHTKLSNPHYPPEIQAECTLINFTVTETGLEDQLLDLVVLKERPDLAAQSVELIKQQNQFKITLSELEADLLQRLANATGDILDDIELVENLEKSKMLSVEISEKVEIAKETQLAIYEASEAYRPAANRGALVFFLMNELNMIHSFYRFSLDSFIIVVKRAIDIVAESLKPKKAVKEELAEGEEAPEEPEEEEPSEEEGEVEITPRTLKKRIDALTDSITFQAFSYTRRGTFERHKLLVATMLCFRIQMRKGALKEEEVEILIKNSVALDVPNQPENLKMIPETMWPSVVGLQKVKVFEDLLKQMESEGL
jgi:dynein heavy chain